MRKFLSSVIAAVTAAAAASSAMLAAYAAPVIMLPEYPSLLSYHAEDSYNYGDFLDSNNTAVYEAFSKLVEPSTKMFTVKLPEPVSLKLSSTPDDFNDADKATFQNAIFQSCKPAVDSVLWDYPEIIWLDPAKMHIGVGDYDISRINPFTGKYTMTLNELTFTPVLSGGFTSIEQINDYIDKLQKNVAELPVSGTTRYEQLLSVHNYITQFTYYDSNGTFTDSAIGALVEPGVVCEGYAKAFKLMCDYLGIPCTIVFGNLDKTNAIGHVWNYVKMEDGNWYAIDVTWDDLDGRDGAEFKLEYFLVGSRYFFRNHTESPDYNITIFTYPTLSAENYDPLTAPMETTTLPPETTTTEDEATTSVTESVSETQSETDTTAAEETTLTSDTTSETDISSTSETETDIDTTAETETTETQTTETTTDEPIVTTIEESDISTETTSSTTTILYDVYDINQDGEVNVADLVLCSKIVLGASLWHLPCDVNDDVRTDIFDLVLMRKRIFQLCFSD